MISDEELDAMIAIQGTQAISAAIAQLSIASERHKKTCEALTELLAIRRRDAAIEKALREDEKMEMRCGATSDGRYYAASDHPWDVSKKPETFASTMELLEFLKAGRKIVHAPTFSEALSALAAGLEGESK